MKVLLDHNIPAKLRSPFRSCEVFTAREMFWDRLRNGDLPREAELSLFDVLLTADQSMFYQQNNARRVIALVVVSTNDWEVLRRKIDLIETGLLRARSGSFELLHLSTAAAAQIGLGDSSW